MATINALFPATSAAFPQRRDQLELLAAIAHIPESPVPLPIHVHGPSGAGKSCMLLSLVGELNDARPGTAAYVACRRIISIKQLLTKVLKTWTTDEEEAGADTMPAFVHRIRSVIPAEDVLQRWLVCLDFYFGPSSDVFDRLSIFQILDDAHYLLELGSSLVPALIRLQQLTERNVVVVMATARGWLPFSALMSPISVLLPAYSRPQLVTILRTALRDRYIDPPGIQSLFDILVEAMVDSVADVCGNVEELRKGIVRIMPVVKELISDGTIQIARPHLAFRHLAPALRDFANHLFAGRSLPPSKDSDRRIVATPVLQRRIDSTVPDLPAAAKYLLIASYLASYNPVAMDRSIFSRSRDGGAGASRRGTRVRGRTATANAASPSARAGKRKANAAPPVPRAHLGPRVFPLDRMLAIYHAVVDGEGVEAVDVLAQVATLVALRYLVRVGGPDALDNVRVRCNVGFETVVKVAQSVRFDLQECLTES
ncbi:origin recognition complex subunit 5 C-terminus-domain-containing protein [Blastocladiella britannica]|nr:origin recognition complex subunit 5 C-terminus-domain-containing protein [Blastocladiella britannica]